MMSIPSDKPGFRALMIEWNTKLADSGFKDIEKLDSRCNWELKHGGNKDRYIKSDVITRQTRVQYFDLIQGKIEKARSMDASDREILCMYVEGISQVEMARKLDCNRVTIYRVITHWLKRWHLK